MALVALAGPLTNVMLAFASAMLLHLVWFAPEPTSRWLVQTLYQSLVLNLVLAIFNMLPIPPLDGSRILLSVMPGVLARPYVKLERFGLIILLGLVFLVPMAARQLGIDLNLFSWLVGLPVAYLTKWFFGWLVTPADRVTSQPGFRRQKSQVQIWAHPEKLNDVARATAPRIRPRVIEIGQWPGAGQNHHGQSGHDLGC